MRFGIMEDFRNPLKWRRPFPEFYNAILDQIVRAETLGYDNVWLTEHHFTEDGYNPSLLPTAAAIAARTSRIRIGSFILLLPYQHPVRAAEDVACIDILSNGRFDFGIGQGYSYHEWNALCMDRRTRGMRMREGIDIIKRLFTEERVSYDGRYTQIKDLTLSPKTVQQPHPPIWIGARGPKAIRNAAKLGYHLMATLGPDPAPLYIETLKAEGRDPKLFNIAQLRMVYLANSNAQAWDECQDHLWHLLTFYQDILAEANDADGDDKPLPASGPAELRHSPLAAQMLIGSPDDVGKKLEHFCQNHQCTDFIMDMQFPGIDPAKATRSMELFARELMPNFRDK
ncbi:MAG: LLM class flavin-dependent oxidoreductase [Proteobacteria bacterium]|nr:MAG: LLM class flavin-dependent oxidoreductase [Pseudomonadota bacterium]